MRGWMIGESVWRQKKESRKRIEGVKEEKESLNEQPRRERGVGSG